MLVHLFEPEKSSRGKLEGTTEPCKGLPAGSLWPMLKASQPVLQPFGCVGPQKFAETVVPFGFPFPKNGGSGPTVAPRDEPRRFVWLQELDVQELV